MIAVESLKHALARLIEFPLNSEPPALDSLASVLNLYSFIEFPLNYPLHYIQDLFFLNLLLPLFVWTTRRYLLVMLAAITLLLTFVTKAPDWLPRSDLTAFFCLGAMASTFPGRTVKLLDMRWLTPVCFAALAGFLLTFTDYWLAGGEILVNRLNELVSVRNMVRVLGSLVLVWLACNLSHSRFGCIPFITRKDIFIAFCLHAVVVSVAWPVFERIAGVSQSSLLAIFLSLAFPAFVFMLVVVARVSLVWLTLKFKRMFFSSTGSIS